MTATLPAPAAESAEDRVGAIEAAGVEYLPEEAATPGRATCQRCSSAPT